MEQFLRIVFAGTVMFGILAGGARAQVSCLPIDRIDLQGITLLSEREARAAVAPFEGRCLGIPQINAALEAITFSYVDKGYITARAYLPEQDIADRVLDIAVVEGKLAEIRFNGETRRVWQAITFPGMIGEVANLRDIEQGLDIIRDMPAYTAEMEISAGTEDGESILDVNATADHRWSAQLGASNHGTPGSGEYLGTLDLTYDHLLGLNESWRLNLSRGVETYPFASDTGGAATHSIGGGLKLPYGRWALEGGYQFSTYETDTLGPITTIGTDGWTHTADISLSRLLTRGQDSKTTVEATLEWRQNVNRIAEITIERSSRTLSTARIDLEHERVLWGGNLSARLGVEQGLEILDAEIFTEQPDGQPNAQFLLADFQLSYYRPWQTAIGGISYSGVLRGQWSEDTLYGAYQFGIGGFSSVRGARAADYTNTINPEAPDEGFNGGLITANSGIVWRNDLVWTPKITLPNILGTLQLYGAIDAGIVYRYDIDRARPLIGSAVGIRTVSGNIVFDLAWQQILQMPNDFEPPAGILLLSVSAKY